MFKGIVVAAAGAWLGAAAALGQQTRPATTQTAFDTATPRGALLRLNQAMRDGDAAEIRQSFIAANPAEVKMVETVADVAAATADLHESAVKAFGPDAGGKFADADGTDTGRIESADITVTGDTASVRYKDSKRPPFEMRKVEGRWALPASQLGKPTDPSALEQQLADLAAQARLMRQIAREIRDARFADADRAADAWHTRMLQAATSQPSAGNPPSTTAPANAPEG